MSEHIPYSLHCFLRLLAGRESKSIQAVYDEPSFQIFQPASCLIDLIYFCPFMHSTRSH